MLAVAAAQGQQKPKQQTGGGDCVPVVAARAAPTATGHEGRASSGTIIPQLLLLLLLPLPTRRQNHQHRNMPRVLMLIMLLSVVNFPLVFGGQPTVDHRTPGG